MGLSRTSVKPKLTREASTSMEDLSFSIPNAPGSVTRPKSMCVPDLRHYTEGTINETRMYHQNNLQQNDPFSSAVTRVRNKIDASKRPKTRRNPVQRAASRLYRASTELPSSKNTLERECVGPEFVVRAALPSKQITIAEPKGNAKKTITVIMLNGQKLDVSCNPNTTTAGQLFEVKSALT